MLAGALYYTALVAVVAATILSAGLAMTRMTIARAAQPYVAVGYQRALATLERSISASMQAGGLPNPAPSPTTIPAGCANVSCTYTTTENIAFTNADAPTAGPSCDPEQTSCAPNVQRNAYVSESRLAALITVNVDDSSGAAVATRTSAVVLRTFSTPPYVAIAGTRDGTFDDVSGAHAAGDDGGTLPATPNPCASSAAGVADDTAVRVAYRNDVTEACSDAGAWANASYDSSRGSNGWSP